MTCVPNKRKILLYGVWRSDINEHLKKNSPSNGYFQETIE